jgi:hypothetical protein
MWPVRHDGYIFKEFSMSLRHPRPRRRTGTFRPWVETLEDRRVLNCTSTFTGGVLTVTGDTGTNTIVIKDNGANIPTFTDPITGQQVTTPPTPTSTPTPGTTLTLSVVCNGATTTFPAPTTQAGALTTVTINLGTKKAAKKGNSVTYNLSAGLRQNAKRTITVNLAKKSNDTFAMTVGQTLVPNMFNPGFSDILGGLDRGSSLNLTVNSGKGNEKISIDAFQGFDIASNASATFNLNGGTGNDDITANFSGVNGGPFLNPGTPQQIAATPGTLTLNMDGKSGDDTVLGFLNMEGGNITATVKANKGTKILGLQEDFNDANQVNLPAAFKNPTHFTGTLTGSGAKSTCFHTANVTASKCKHDIIV